MSKHGTLAERRTLKEAATYLHKLIAATNDEHSTCAVFNTTFAPLAAKDPDVNAWYREQVRIYVESWIIPCVDAVLASMEDEDVTQEQHDTLEYFRNRWL